MGVAWRQAFGVFLMTVLLIASVKASQGHVDLSQVRLPGSPEERLAKWAWAVFTITACWLVLR